jgi:ribosomal protein S18 acetylase RimI-like enzyme
MDKIIQLNKKHIDQLASIDYASEHQGDREHNISRASMKKHLVTRFKKKQESFFGYKRGNELIGYVTLKHYFPGHKHCEVYWLAVKKKCQGQGIGRKLMLFIEQYAKKRGFRKVCLYTGKDMTKTRGFYEKIGYASINEFPGYYGYSSGNTTAVLYIKNL